MDDYSNRHKYWRPTNSVISIKLGIDYVESEAVECKSQDMPLPRGAHTAVSKGRHIFICGGLVEEPSEDPNLPGNDYPTREIWCLEYGQPSYLRFIRKTQDGYIEWRDNGNILNDRTYRLMVKQITPMGDGSPKVVYKGKDTKWKIQNLDHGTLYSAYVDVDSPTGSSASSDSLSFKYRATGIIFLVEKFFLSDFLSHSKYRPANFTAQFRSHKHE